MFLTIDIGTSTIKAAFFDDQLQYMGLKTLELSSASNLEIPALWKKSLIEIINFFKPHFINLKKLSKKNLYIIISGQGPSTIYLNSKNKVIHYVSWQSKDIINNNYDTSSFYLPQLAYVKKYLPSIYSKTAMILAPAEYVSFLLCDKFSSFIPNNNFNPYIWPSKGLRDYDIDLNKIAPSIKSGSILGQANSALSKKLGISCATVIAGGLDYISAKIGAGIINDTTIFQRSGTSVMCNLSIHNTRIKDILSSSNTLSQIKPTFSLPSYFSNYYNIAYLVKYYDELYTLINTKNFFGTCHIPDLISTYKKHSNYLKNLSLKFNEQGSSKNLLKDELGVLIKKLISTSNYNQTNKDFFDPKNQKNFKKICLYLLLQQLQTTTKILSALVTNTGTQDPKLAVSGGHAHNTVLMQLQASYLNLRVETFNPIYTELLGNLYLALSSLSESKSLKKIITSQGPGLIYYPKFSE